MTTRLNTAGKAVIAVLTVLGVVAAMNQAFFWNLFGITMLQNSYLYVILMFFMPIVFLLFPVLKSHKDRKLPVYDAAIALLTFVICGYFALNGENISVLGWDKSLTYPTITLVFSILLWAIVLEALRRTAGLVVTGIALVFSLYPMFALGVPVPFLQGIPYDFFDSARIHAMGVESILGLPLQTAAGILIGFLLFGVALQHTGGATFFYDISQSMFGRFRGGNAKVSVISSGLMGMMSGSAVSNVLTTGPMTIPAMKKTGFPGRFAAGVESTAATGGTIMPPIMGTAAFLMVSFVGVPYAQIALAALIPALLYYIGIFVQVDAYSGKAGLRDVKKELLPRAGRTLAKGWMYVAALAGLVIFLATGGNESQAPYWIVAFLLVVSLFFKGDKRLTPKTFFDFVLASGKTIAEILGIIAGVGLIVGGLSMTGVSLSMARELINLVGDNIVLVLIAGAATSFVLGMGMTVSAVYVFLAIVLAPALTGMGIDPVAAHLFVIYWATVSYITPPVALAAFSAANIAGTPPMSTAFTAMRLGLVTYIVPFAFVLNPALVAQGGVAEVLVTFAFAVVGVFFLGCAFEGFAIGVGRRLPVVLRVVLGAAGLLAFAPEIWSSLAGLVLGAVVMVIARFWNLGGPWTTEEREARYAAADAMDLEEVRAYAAAHHGHAQDTSAIGPTGVRGVAVEGAGHAVLPDDPHATAQKH
ncbi:TRAP transporter permease [Brevibacterium litoralis]|uniref:TRAP transporter permease n=1 Tax=Brevibacterium litoralis TaxID=3138935 RepID=UPI0032EDA59F